MKWLEELVVQLEPRFVSLELSAVTHDVVQLIGSLGLEIWPWTVCNKEHATQMMMLNVDAIVTDVPELCLEILNEHSSGEGF